MPASPLRLLLVATSLLALIASGCGARTVLRDTYDGGSLPTDVAPGTDVPLLPIDAPPPLIDAPPPPVDAPVPPPLDVPPPPVDAPIEPGACERALPVADGTVLVGQDATGLDGGAPSCPLVTVPGAGARWYRTTVDPGQTLSVTAESEGGLRPPLVRAYQACTDRFCSGGTNTSFDGRNVHFTYVNAGPARLSILVAVSGIVPGIPVRYTLRIAVTRAQPNVACAAPTRVVNGTMLRGENLASASAPAAWCSTGSSANALYYAVRVGPGELLTARATNADGNPFPVPALRLGVGCMTTNCLATASANGPMATQLTYLNTTGLPQELLLAADAGFAGSPPFRYDLSISVALPPYVLSRTSIDCDRMTTAAVIAGAVGDDVGTPAIALPIRFPYFGSPMAAWSVSTNGYLQVWSTSTGASMGALGIAALPSTSAPPNMIAPFWDDLEVRSAEGMDVRWQAFDAPARHLTVQWSTGFCCGVGPDRVTFQAKLFERSGVVEFHYCDQRGGERARGQVASVGLQDETGSRGVSAQVGTPTLDPMTAFRFTPRL